MINLNGRQKQHIGLQFIFDLAAPKSAYGKENLQNLRPFTPGQQGELQRQLDNIEKTRLHRPHLESEYRRLEQVFANVKNLRSSLLKCQDGVLGEIDLFEIKGYLLQLKEIMPLFAAINSQTNYKGVVFHDTSQALELLDPEKTGVASFHISGSYSEQLAFARRQKQEIEKQMRQYDFKSTPSPLLDARRRLAVAEEREEEKVREELSVKLKPFVPLLLANADMIGDLDMTIQKAGASLKFNAAKPVISCDGFVSFTDMQNPQIASDLQKQNKSFTPISISLSKGSTVITGANMGGKSVALVTTALNISLIHYGFYPFAKSATCPLFDSMHIISGNMESQAHGLSSFGGEVIGINQIIADIECGFTCVFIDEIAKGTNPGEGAAIAQGVTAFLNEKHAISLISSHYDKVALHAGAHYQIIGLKQADIEALKQKIKASPVVLENALKAALISDCMDYNLAPAFKNQKPPQEALNICYLMGMPLQLIAKIKENYEK